jgi:hypothetical protein
MRSPLPPPKPPSRIDRLIDRFLDWRRVRRSWRVRCDRCGWVEDAGSEEDARSLSALHKRDHERKGSATEIKVYPATAGRRFWDSSFDSE